MLQLAYCSLSRLKTALILLYLGTNCAVLFYSWYSESEKPHGQLMLTLVSIAADASCDGISTSVFTALERLLPTSTGSLGSGDPPTSTSTTPPPPPPPPSSVAGGTLTSSGVGDAMGGGGSSSSSSSSGSSGDSATSETPASATAGGVGSSITAINSQVTVVHHLYGRLLVHVQALLKIQANYYGVVGDRVLTGLGSFLCRLLDSGVGRQALRTHLQISPHFCSILLSPIPPKLTAPKTVVTSQKQSKELTTNKASEKDENKDVVKKSAISSPRESDVDTNALPEPIVDFLITLFQIAQKNPKDTNLSGICGHIWSWVESGALQRWLTSALILSQASTANNDSPAPPAAISTLAPKEMLSASSLSGFIRKRKDRKGTSKTKIMIDNPFADTVSSARSMKSKVSEAMVLEDEDEASFDVDDAIKDPDAMVSSLRLVLRLRDSWKLLEAMAAYICSQNTVLAKQQCVSLLRSLETVGNSLVDGSDGVARLQPITSLLPIMISLADGAGSQGHLSLFRATTHWLELCKTVVLSSTTSEDRYLRPVQQLLDYMSDILVAVKVSGEEEKAGGASPEIGPDSCAIDTADSDWLDDPKEEDDDETTQEDSDEDSLCNKLCTYTRTQKEFVNQHWYHCHSCQMEDGVGVCSVCAKVCHKGHDITYAKYGSFFCDCGAMEDASCQALVKRSPTYKSGSSQSATASSGFGVGPLLIPSRSNRALSPSPEDNKTQESSKHRRELAHQLEGVCSSLCSSQAGVAGCTLELMKSLLPILEEETTNRAAISSVNSSRGALATLHTVSKTVENTDQLMFATLGSQEGAFENVRLNYSGEQGQTVRQLVTSHTIRRVAMCCLTSPNSRRQHLAVSHEKGKITLLQLSSLLRQQVSASYVTLDTC